MGNCVPRCWTGGGLEETTMSAAGTSATLDEPSNFHTALEEFNLISLDELALEDQSGAASSSEPTSDYFSTRVEEMMRSKSQFPSAVEHEIEYSRVHWSEVSGRSELSEEDDNNDYGDVNRENEKVFAELVDDPQWKHHRSGVSFFLQWPPALKLGRRIAKAANILLHRSNGGLAIFVADFECSIGVVGTGFFRAPETLLALKKNRSAIDLSEKVDVYSYGMICFEVVTGHLPFEGELEACNASNDCVIEGQRPKLPSDLDVTLRDLIERCWNPIPSERPSFSEIVEVLVS